MVTAPRGGQGNGTDGTARDPPRVAESKPPILERCDKALGTLALHEDTSATWYLMLSGQMKLGSTVPVLKVLAKESNCFVVVERGRAMNNMMQERALQQSGETRQGSNFGKGQMVAADYSMSPSITFNNNAGDAGVAFGAAYGGFYGGVLGITGGMVTFKEASTTLTLVDNRSGVQLGAADGSARNIDFGANGGLIGSGLGASGGGYSNTAEGKVVVAAFIDSFNNLIKAVKNYKAQEVKGGLGTGGSLIVDTETTLPSNDVRQNHTDALHPFVNLDAQRRVRPSQRIAVQVWLSQRRETPDATVQPPSGQQPSLDGRLQLPLPRDRKQWTIGVALSAPGFDFEANTSNLATLMLTDEETSDTARFTLIARDGQEGTHRLRATLWHEGTFLGSVSRDIEIESARATEGPILPYSSAEISSSLAAAPSSRMQAGPTIPDLSLHEATPAAPTEAERKPLPVRGPATPDLTVYVRHEDPRALGRAEIYVSSPHLKGPPATETVQFPPDAARWLSTWLDRLQRFQSANDAAAISQNVASLRGLGVELYQKLAPTTFKSMLTNVLKARQGVALTIQIYSNNPAIPWELMRPGTIAGREIDFLSTDFRLARWPVDNGERTPEVPLQSIPLREIVVIAPKYPDERQLGAQDQEVAFLSRMRGFRRTGGTFEALRQVAANPPAGIVHFAGHGEMAGASPEQRRYLLRLEDSRFDAVAWRGLRISAAAPTSLYFFNACELGITESQAGSVAGWAPVLLDGGAGGFIGGLWSLRDGPASRFAMQFYGNLSDPDSATSRRSVAEALRHARKLFFETGDPTYLAYAYYGDVNLELSLSP